MRVVSLTVFDETASITLMLPEFPSIRDQAFLDQIKTGTVLTIENGATIFDANNCMVLTLPSEKYSKI